MKKLLATLIAIVCLQFTVSSNAQVPGVINYQGRIVDNGTNFTGTGLFEFAFVNSGGSTNYWSNDGTPVGQPANAVSLTVTKGMYSILLGSTAVSNMTMAISPSVVNNSNVILRVWFNDGVNGFQQLSPDQPLSSVAYAQLAAVASNVPNGAITSAQLASNAVTTANIAPGAVTTAAIANGAVTASQLASNTITAAQVAPGYGLVPSGTLVLSPTPANPALVAAGFAPLIAFPWTEATNSAPWSAREGHGVVTLNGQMWVLGGYNAGWLNDVWSSSNGVTWTEVTSNAPWSARSGAGVVALNNQLWVLGGNDASGTNSSVNDVWSSSNGVTWTEVTNTAPWSARSSFGAVAFNNQLWVMGGIGSSGWLSDVWSSSNGVTWTEVTSAAPWPGRYALSAVAFNGQIWVMGGWNGNNYPYYFNDVWSSSNGVTWTEVTSAASWRGRSAFGAVALNNQLWVLGGFYSLPNGADQTYFGDVWSSTNGASWVQATNAAPWTSRSSLGALALNNRLWVLGGFVNIGSGYTNDVWYSQGVTNMLGSYFLYQKQ